MLKSDYLKFTSDLSSRRETGKILFIGGNKAWEKSSLSAEAEIARKSNGLLLSQENVLSSEKCVYVVFKKLLFSVLVWYTSKR